MKPGTNPDIESDFAMPPSALDQETRRYFSFLNTPGRKAILVVTVLAVTFLLYFAAYRADRFGFYRDDSMYVVMGKALATGQDYRIISLPDEPLQTKSPPFYPFLLSIVWALKPEFPQNLTPMMLLTASFTLLFLVLTYKYLVENGYANKWQALAVVGLTAINWRTIVLASGIYSEMVYAALSVTALYLGERYEKTRSRMLPGTALGAVVGLAFLTRSAGIALLIALVLYFLLRRRLSGGWPVLLAGLVVLAWLGWGSLNSPNIENSNAGSYESYFQTFRALIAQQGQSNLVGLLGVIARNALGLILISIPVVCLGLAYESVLYFGFAFLFIAGGFIRQCRGGLRLMHIYVVTYLAIHLLWPYTAYDRFLMPLLPFLLLFLLIEVQTMLARITKVFAEQTELAGRASAAFIGLALLVSAGACLYNYGLGVYRSLNLSTWSKDVQAASEDIEAIEWIKSQTNPSDVVICYRDPLYYLHTGRKAARSSLVRDGGFLQGSQASADETAKTIFRIIDENKARFWVLTPSDFGLERQPDIERQNYQTVLEQDPGRFTAVFQSSDGGSKIFRINDARPELR